MQASKALETWRIWGRLIKGNFTSCRGAHQGGRGYCFIASARARIRLCIPIIHTFSLRTIKSSVSATQKLVSSSTLTKTCSHRFRTLTKFPVCWKGKWNLFAHRAGECRKTESSPAHLCTKELLARDSCRVGGHRNRNQRKKTSTTHLSLYFVLFGEAR